MGPGFGRLLVEHRVRAGLTQEEVAERAGISDRALRNLELGLVANPRSRTVAALITALELDPGRAEALAAVVRAARAGAARAVGSAAPIEATTLPLPTTTFVGRADALRNIQDLLTSGRTSTILITGRAGMGKTTVAAQLAQRLWSAFPDGQLHLDLGSHPETAGTVTRVLRQLGATSADLTADPDQQLDQYHSATMRHRLLIIADGATAAQSRLLMPRGPTPTALIITSRSKLPSLAEVPRVLLTAFTEEEATAVLTRSITDSRPADEPEQLRRIVKQCEGLPLALGVVGARLSVDPDRPLSWLADRLAVDRHRLDELSIDGVGVRSSLTANVAELTEPARGLLHRLSRLPAGPIPTGLAASAHGLDVPETERLLDELVTLHLVEPRTDSVGESPGFVLPELVRLVSRELAASQPIGDEATE